MNFLSAVKHAVIGYGIRRKVWADKAILCLDNLGELRWIKNCGRDVATLLGSDATISVTAEDIKATDWEVL